eukprot:5606313-Pleurochrysis_carterae.AAC.3
MKANKTHMQERCRESLGTVEEGARRLRKRESERVRERAREGGGERQEQRKRRRKAERGSERERAGSCRGERGRRKGARRRGVWNIKTERKGKRDGQAEGKHSLAFSGPSPSTALHLLSCLFGRLCLHEASILARAHVLEAGVCSIACARGRCCVRAGSWARKHTRRTDEAERCISIRASVTQA